MFVCIDNNDTLTKETHNDINKYYQTLYILFLSSNCIRKDKPYVKCMEAKNLLFNIIKNDF